MPKASRGLAPGGGPGARCRTPALTRVSMRAGAAWTERCRQGRYERAGSVRRGGMRRRGGKVGDARCRQRQKYAWRGNGCRAEAKVRPDAEAPGWHGDVARFVAWGIAPEIPGNAGLRPMLQWPVRAGSGQQRVRIAERRRIHAAVDIEDFAGDCAGQVGKQEGGGVADSATAARSKPKAWLAGGSPA